MPPAVRPLIALATAGLTLAVAGAAAAAGPPATAFVPADFRVEQRIDADITGDARRDAVLVLVERAPAGAPSPSGDGPPELARRLVVLRARADGGFARIGEGRRILLCTRCGGAFFGVRRTPVTVKVVRGVVIVEQESGSRELVFQRFRLRPEGARRTRLIGTDIRRTDRLTGVSREVSTNLLTGDRIVTVTRPDGTTTTRRSTVRVPRTFLESVDRARA